MADMETIEALLSKAQQQLERQRQHQQETGNAFNIFTVLDRERKEERTHCRLLYELLNPEGSHGCGDAFLRGFFQNVLGKQRYEQGTRVCREKNIDDGRIDLVLEGKSYYYPIEVKIDAGDQYRQIERYANFAERQRKGRSGFDIAFYYLTLNGHRPSRESIGETPPDRIICISFPEQIKGWLAQCVEIARDKPNVKVILNQYIQLIDRLENTTMADSLAKMIGSSKNGYESAMEISKKLPLVQAGKMIAVFEKIQEIVGDRLVKVEGYSLQEEDREQDALNYYTAAKRPDPSLVYCIRSKEERSVELWFQVDHYNDTLWYGVVLRKGEDIPNTEKDIQAFSDMFDNDAWKKTIESLSPKNYKWWVCPPKELPQSGNPLKFRADDEGYCDLFDEGTFHKKMEEIQAEIDRQIEHIQRTGLPAD